MLGYFYEQKLRKKGRSNDSNVDNVTECSRRCAGIEARGHTGRFIRQSADAEQGSCAAAKYGGSRWRVSASLPIVPVGTHDLCLPAAVMVPPHPLCGLRGTYAPIHDFIGQSCLMFKIARWLPDHHQSTPLHYGPLQGQSFYIGYIGFIGFSPPFIFLQKCCYSLRIGFYAGSAADGCVSRCSIVDA